MGLASARGSRQCKSKEPHPWGVRLLEEANLESFCLPVEPYFFSTLGGGSSSAGWAGPVGAAMIAAP